MVIRGSMLELVEEEEARLKTLAREKEEQEKRAQALTVEEYYGNRYRTGADGYFEGASRSKVAKISFEDYQ